MSHRVLLATIGTRDPVMDGEMTGPSRAAARLQPAIVVLFHTGRTEPEALATAAYVREHSARRDADVRLVLLQGDATDEAALVEQCRDHLERVRAEGVVTTGEALDVCATSGTPQMGSALTAAVTLRFPDARHWQALNPKEAAGPDLLVKAQPEAQRIWGRLADGLNLLRSGRPAEALEAMGRHQDSDAMGRSLPHLRTAIVLARLLRALSEYAAYQAAEALDQLRADSARKEVLALADWYGGVLAGWERGDDAPMPKWPLELVAMATREFEGGRRVLGLIRLATAAEVAYAVRLIGKHGIDPADLGPSRARVEELLGRRYRPGRTGRAHISQSQQRRLLDLLETGAPSLEQDERAVSLADLRNRLLHVVGGTSDDELEEAFRQGTGYLAALFERFGWGSLEAVPSMPAGVRAAIDVIADDARVTVPA